MKGKKILPILSGDGLSYHFYGRLWQQFSVNLSYSGIKGNMLLCTAEALSQMVGNPTHTPVTHKQWFGTGKVGAGAVRRQEWREWCRHVVS